MKNTNRPLNKMRSTSCATIMATLALAACAPQAQQNSGSEQQEQVQDEATQETSQAQPSIEEEPETAAANIPEMETDIPSTAFSGKPSEADYKKAIAQSQTIIGLLPGDIFGGEKDPEMRFVQENENASNVFESSYGDGYYSLVLYPRRDGKTLALIQNAECFEGCEYMPPRAFVYDPQTGKLDEVSNPFKTQDSDFLDDLATYGMEEDPVNYLPGHNDNFANFAVIGQSELELIIYYNAPYLEHKLATLKCEWDGSKFNIVDRYIPLSEDSEIGIGIGPFILYQPAPTAISGYTIGESRKVSEWQNDQDVRDSKGKRVLTMHISTDGTLNSLTIYEPRYTWFMAKVGSSAKEYIKRLGETGIRARRMADKVYMEGIHPEFENSAIVLSLEDVELPDDLQEGYATTDYKIKEGAIIKALFIDASVG